MSNVRNPRVSVILTTFNRCGVLEDTVMCLLRQTFRDFELIICDDASTDETPAVASKMLAVDPRVRYCRNEANVGMPENLNRGIQVARGEYVANIHDGDIYGSELLEHWVTALDQCPDAGFAFCRHRERTADGQEVVTDLLPLERCGRGTELLRIIHARRDFTSPIWGTVMARRTAYEMVGPFRRRYGARADVDMWLRLLERYGVGYVPSVDITLPSKAELPLRFRWNPLQRIYQRNVAGRLIMLESRIRMANGKPIEVIRQCGGFIRLLVQDAVFGTRRWKSLSRGRRSAHQHGKASRPEASGAPIDH